MAGTLTHFKFGNDLYKSLNNSLINKDYFLIGNQGHDLIYFIRLWEYPIRNKYFKYTKELQKVDFENFKNSIKTDNIKVKSFMYGYLVHELLDRKVHPYINEVTHDDENVHALLESTIDVKINDLKEIKKIIPKHLKIDTEFKAEITKIFDTYFNNNYYSKRILKGINHVYPFLWLYRFDKLGIKRILYSILNKKHLRFLSYHYSLKEISNIDITDFIKLYNEALLDSEKLINDLEKK